jgi:hypothetical protein
MESTSRAGGKQGYGILGRLAQEEKNGWQAEPASRQVT